ncbi:MAG: type IV toxin-antitoxin system AbiEi family antitoxin domain-containing protein [Pseudomonadota bacterium]
MQTITEKLMYTELADRIITASQLDRLLGGSEQRRYGQVNRALKAGELLRLKRGLYVLPDQFRKVPLHPFAVAQALVPGSYVSFESALSFHGWIPEGVFTTTSVAPGRKTKTYEAAAGRLFTFHPLAVDKSCFLELVAREQVDAQTILLANPLRALMDLVCFRKVSWNGIEWLTEGLRIDPDFLASIKREDVRALAPVYLHKRVNVFLSSLKEELQLD